MTKGLRLVVGYVSKKKQIYLGLKSVFCCKQQFYKLPENIMIEEYKSIVIFLFLFFCIILCTDHWMIVINAVLYRWQTFM